MQHRNTESCSRILGPWMCRSSKLVLNLWMYSYPKSRKENQNKCTHVQQWKEDLNHDITIEKFPKSNEHGNRFYKGETSEKIQMTQCANFSEVDKLHNVSFMDIGPLTRSRRSRSLLKNCSHLEFRWYFVDPPCFMNEYKIENSVHRNSGRKMEKITWKKHSKTWLPLEKSSKTFKFPVVVCKCWWDITE